MSTRAICGCGSERIRVFDVKPEAARMISYRCCHAARHRPVQKFTRAQSDATELTLAPTDLLLDWVASQNGALQPNIVVDASASTAGRRLRAIRHQDPDDVLLSVPLSAVFADLVC